MSMSQKYSLYDADIKVHNQQMASFFPCADPISMRT